MKPNRLLPFLLFALPILGCGSKEQPPSAQEEILAAFESLDSSLQSSVEIFNEKNADQNAAIVMRIEDEMEEGNPEHAEILRLTNEVSAQSLSIQAYTSALSEELEKIAGLDPETGELANMKETETATAFLMGSDPHANAGGGNGEAHRLRLRLEEYWNWANELPKRMKADPKALDCDTLAPIVVQPKQQAYQKHGTVKSHLSWEASNFSDKPVIASLAMLEKIKLDLEEVEYQLLDCLSWQMGILDKEDF